MSAATGIFVPGPAQIATGTGSAGAAEFLGYAKEGVRIRETAFKRPVRADFAGTQMPADMALEGKIAMIEVPILKYDPAVLSHLSGRMLGGAGGVVQANEIGTLVLTEGKSFQLWIKSPYQSKSAFSNYAAGYRFPCAILPDDMSWNISTEEQVIRMTFIGLVSMNTSTLSGTLYDNDMTGFPSLT